MSKIQYNEELLATYYKDKCLSKVNADDKINCNTYLTGKCIMPDCNNTYTKKFHILHKSQIYTCKTCTTINAVSKCKNTCIEKYGVDSVHKVQEIRDKIVNTLTNKYGVSNPMHINESKIKVSEKLKMHIKSISKNTDTPIKYIKDINLKNSKIIEKYGQLNFRSSEIYKEKCKKGVLKKYGVEYNTQNKNTMDKMKSNNVLKYGVPYTAQVPEIYEKATKSRFRYYDYKLPSGNTIKIQGYEKYALDDLINTYNISENDITTGCINVPTIWYYDLNNNKKRHYVDIYIPNQNKCIEVKSSFTVKMDNVFIKQKYAKELGYLYEIWVYDNKGNIINKHL